jgi:hypothetical protein
MVTRKQGIPRGAKAITMRFRVDGGGIEDAEHCGPAAVHLYIERKGADVYQDDGKRWWARVGVPLRPGECTLTILLGPENWSGILGEPAAGNAGFPNTLANAKRVGMTFGGCHFGHGVYASAARFTLLSFEVR